MRRFLIAVAIAALVPAVATAATTIVSGKFKGQTSQGDQFKVQVVRGRLERSSVNWVATCDAPGSSLSGTTALTGLMQGSRYKTKAVYTLPVKSGVKAKHTAHAQFTIKNHHLYGTFKLTAVVFSTPGQVMATCSTPTITFRSKS